MNWTSTKEKEIIMWKETFGKSRSYISKRKTEKRREGLKMKK